MIRDNFRPPLEQIKSFRTPSSSTPIQKFLCKTPGYIGRYKVFPSDFHTSLVIHHFQMSVIFFQSVIDGFIQNFSSKVVLYTMKLLLKILYPRIY